MRISVRHIQEVVAADFDIPVGAMWHPTRERMYSQPRQYAMLLARELTPLSVTVLGKLFDRDHTTILHGIRAAEKRISNDPTMALKVGARKLLLQCETGHSALARILRHIPDPAAQKIVVMSKWERGEISASRATCLIRELELEAA